jgi:L-threonylcarbamoyladenylate synthase
MKTLLLKATDSDCIDQAVSLLKNGKLVGIPTETVYGLAADATHTKAIQEIFKVKKRPPNHPLILHLPDLSDLSQWAINIPDITYALAKQFMPGSLSVLLHKNPSVSNEITGGSNKICIRIPHHETTLKIIKRLGNPIVAPSANIFGRISPTSADHVMNDLFGEIDAVVDGGECRVGIESTIVDLTTPTPSLLRPGGVNLFALEKVLHSKILIPDSVNTKISGNLVNHYQPTTKLTPIHKEDILTHQLIGAADSTNTIFLLFEDLHELQINKYLMPVDVDKYSQLFYGVLRVLDKAGFQEIFIQIPPKTPEWLAINDRILKASHK